MDVEGLVLLHKGDLAPGCILAVSGERVMVVLRGEGGRISLGTHTQRKVGPVCWTTGSPARLDVVMEGKPFTVGRPHECSRAHVVDFIAVVLSPDDRDA